MGLTLLSLHGNVYARVMERRVCPLGKPQVQGEQCSFVMVMDQLFILSRKLEESWLWCLRVFVRILIWKAFDAVGCVLGVCGIITGNHSVSALLQ